MADQEDRGESWRRAKVQDEQTQGGLQKRMRGRLGKATSSVAMCPR